MLISNQPLTPQQLALLRRRMDSAQAELTYGGMPTDLGSGLQRLGTAIGYAAMKHRYKSQFPDAPPMPGGGYAPQAKPPIQNFLETISGNRMPWQFPAAPSQPGAASNAPKPVAASPRQGDGQPPAISNVPSATPSPMMGSVFGAGNTPPAPQAGMASTLPGPKPGGLFGLFRPQTASGLW